MILKGKIIDLKFMYVIYVFVSVFGFVFVFVILGLKIINQNLCFRFLGWARHEGTGLAGAQRGRFGVEKNLFIKGVGFGS